MVPYDAIRTAYEAYHDNDGWDALPLDRKFALAMPHASDGLLQDAVDNPAHYDSVWVELCQQELADRKWWV